MIQTRFETVDLRQAEEIEQLVRETFAGNQKRLGHILEVAARVQNTAQTLADKRNIPISVDRAYRAALLHDIGYAPELQQIGFHPIDGARYLQRRGFPELASFIVCHSNSPELAAIRALAPVPLSDDLIADLITYWDVRVQPGGTICSYEERMQEIAERHSRESDVWQAHVLAGPRIRSIQQRVELLLNGELVQ